MSGAELKKLALSAGCDQEAIYRKKNISQNLHTANQSIAKTRNKLHLTSEEWQRWAIFVARLALDSAPDEVRAEFIGKPSETPKNAIFLAEVFTTLVMQAEDMAAATNIPYDFADLWNESVALWGGQP